MASYGAAVRDAWGRWPLRYHAVLFLVLASLTRLLLLLSTGLEAVPLSLWPGLFARGLVFDVLVLPWLLAPALIAQALMPVVRRSARWSAALRLVLFWSLACVLIFLSLSEWTFWQEFASRLNFIAVDYLIYTHEVIGNIRESYPVGGLLAGVALLALVLTVWLRRPLMADSGVGPQGRQRLWWMAAALVLPAASWELSDIDQMAFSGNAYANELAGNGLMTFAAALQRNELDYLRFYATLPDEQIDRTLARLQIERKPVDEALRTPVDEDEAFDAARLPLKRPPRHVVLITVESLSAQFLGKFGNPDSLTPRLDRLADEGLLFTRLYATGTRTVRGLEATSLGTPPIPGQAIVRRPGNEHLATVGEILNRQGFESLFFYGGYGYFDNMNAYFAGNSYRVIDRTSIPKSSIGFENIWGVGDEFLFDHVVSQLDAVHASGKRFLAQVMTTSNHRPYTYADGRIDIPSPGGRKGAVKYTDYSIGHFIDQARSKPWFRDTLFVIVADHCASVAGRTKLPVPGYHIPMIMYAPDLLKPGRYDGLVSQIDIPPTLLDMLGVPGDDHFIGTSVFEQGPEFRRRAFISNYQELGYLTPERLIVLGPKRKVEAFAIDAQGSASPTAVDPQLAEEAVAYYQGAFRSFKSGALKLP